MERRFFLVLPDRTMTLPHQLLLWKEVAFLVVALAPRPLWLAVPLKMKIALGGARQLRSPLKISPGVGRD
jgi:hypothetical protein